MISSQCKCSWLSTTFPGIILCDYIGNKLLRLLPAGTGSWGAISNNGGAGYTHARLNSLPGTPDGGHHHPGAEGVGSSMLTLAGASEEHEGRYLCQAANGVGPGLSKMVTVTVLGEKDNVDILFDGQDFGEAV